MRTQSEIVDLRQDGVNGALKLRTVPHPECPDRRVFLHRTWKDAVRHLCDHLLTWPECDAWALVLSDASTLPLRGDPDQRWEYAGRALESHGRTARALYDRYCEAISSDALDARTLGWYQSSKALTVAVGTSGILMVIEVAVKTAFLAGQGNPEATRMSGSDTEWTRVLSRESGMRSGRSAACIFSPRENRRKQRREALWTREERLYYRVFRPCIQFIRKSHHRCRDLCGRLIRCDYALLKDRLPPRSRLSYEDWLRLRGRCRGGLA